MAAPTMALLAAFWLGLVGGHLVVPLQMLPMLPVTLAVMFNRFDDYVEEACPIRPINAR